MRRSRRAIAGMIVLGIVIALVVFQWRRGDVGTASHVEAAPGPASEAGVAAQVAPAAMPAPDHDPMQAVFAELRRASSGSSDEFCVQVVKDVTKFALGERGVSTAPQPPRLDGDLWRAELDKLQRNLDGQASPEQLLAALLTAPPQVREPGNPDAVARLLEFGTRATSSGSPLLAWHALRACHDAGQSCPYTHLEQGLLDTQPQNAEAWALVATLRHGRGDTTGALAAMQGAARASTSNWYWPETLALLERSLAAHTAISYPDRAISAIGVGAAAGFPAPQGLRRMCTEESSSSRTWAEACLAFGTVRAKHNETDLGRSLAFTIREQALRALGDRDGAAEAAAEYARHSAERMAGGTELVQSMSELQVALIEADPALFHDYLGAIRQSGERAGQREFLRREMPQLMERAGLLDRDGARECAAQVFLPAQAAGDTRQATAEYQVQVADELHVTVRDQGGGGPMTLRVGPDGRITSLRGRPADIAAAGKTAEQLQREISALRFRGRGTPEVLVIPIPARSREELRREFDSAR